MRLGRFSRFLVLSAWLLACQPAPAARAPQPAAPAPAQGAAPAPAASAPAAPPPSQRLTVAIVSPSEVFSIPWIGRDTGIFAAHGFEVEVPLVTGSPRLIQSLVAGDFDYAMAGVTAALRARMQGADPVILATSRNDLTQSVVVHPQAGIRTLQDLRGRTIGISQIGSEADVFLHIALDLAGLRPDEVSVLQTGGHPQTVAALASGNLDAGVLGGANVLKAQQIGAVKLASGRELGVLSPSGILATTRHAIERDRDRVRRFLRAYVEAVHFYKTQRDATIRILQANMGGLSAEEVAFLYDDLNEALPPLPVPREEALQAVLDREPDPQARNFKPGDFLDLSFLQEIEQSGFLATLYK